MKKCCLLGSALTVALLLLPYRAEKTENGKEWEGLLYTLKKEEGEENDTFTLTLFEKQCDQAKNAYEMLKTLLLGEE